MPSINPSRVRDFSSLLRHQALASGDLAVEIRRALTLAELSGGDLVIRADDRADTLELVADELEDRADLAQRWQLPFVPLSPVVHGAVFAQLESVETVQELDERIRSWSGTDNDPILDGLIRKRQRIQREVEAFERTGKGDLGGRFTTERRVRFAVNGDNPVLRGRNTVIRGLADTGNPRQIQQDEFEVIDHGNGSYTVVLAGVIDLSKPHLGLDPNNRSERDMDQNAVPSATSARVEDNAYALAVREYLMETLPPGSKLMLLGHSYGADTAGDLAADPVFNGEHGFEVTHVVAAAYDSQPQLSHIPSQTKVLLVQNDVDVAVAAERIGYYPNHVVQSGSDAGANLLQGNGAAAVGHGTVAWLAYQRTKQELADGAFDVLLSPFRTVFDSDVRENLVEGDVSQAVIENYGLDSFAERTVALNDSQVEVIFSGGFAGAGHHQDNYIHWAEHVEEPEVTSFFDSISRSGYTATGTSTAVDISAE